MCRRGKNVHVAALPPPGATTPQDLVWCSKLLEGCRTVATLYWHLFTEASRYNVTYSCVCGVFTITLRHYLSIYLALTKIYTSLFARKAAATSEKKHQTHNKNKQKRKKITLKSGGLVNSVTTFIHQRTLKTALT